MKQVSKTIAVSVRLMILATSIALLLTNPFPTFAQSDEITLSNTLPPGRPGTRLPADKDLLFYIQRSMNRNTVVYVAKRNSSGKLRQKNPIGVYWRRFASDGKISKLTYIERTMAFGVVAQHSKNENSEFLANLVSYPAKKGLLKLDNDNQPVLMTTIGNHKVRLIFAFIQLTGNSVFPQIVYVDVIGQDVSSGKYIRRRVYSPKKLRRLNSDAK